ncbi:MAG: hypothetical protein KDH94_04425 [Coxiellaceae bacterium]|nr:hypothetical protein [Coxiellaceae bacterium]
MKDKRLMWNTFFSRLAALLFLLMMVRYRALYVLMIDPSRNIYSILVVAIFYLLNLISMVGLFIPKNWGYISCYFSIPLSTFLFASSYLFFLTDYLSGRTAVYVIPFVNALILVAIVVLQVKRRHIEMQYIERA